jgi:hypothetical protein
MRHAIICVSGFSGVGKDEFVSRLVTNHSAMHTGLADPAKRHMADLYGFTRDQLFGPSPYRNAGDLRYPKHKFYSSNLKLLSLNEYKDELSDYTGSKINLSAKYWGFYHETLKKMCLVKEGDSSFWLSPRESLQLYCELMNNLYQNTWIRSGIETHMKLMQRTIDQPRGNDHIMLLNQYDRMRGVFERPYVKQCLGGVAFTCFSDFRHKHEIQFTREVAGIQYEPVIVRVKRPSIPNPPYDHRSETEQSTIPDSEFDFIINNDGSVQDLHHKADKLVNLIRSNEKMVTNI